MEPYLESPANARTKTIILTGIGVFLLIFVAVSILSYMRRQGGTNDDSNARPAAVAKNREKRKNENFPISSFPKVSVGRWNLLGAAAIAGAQPSRANVFSVRENLTKADFTKLSVKLNFSPQSTDENEERLVGGQAQSTESAMLYLQKKSGAFLYRATDGFAHASSLAGQLEPQRIQEFALRLTGDANVRFAASYQKKSVSGVTYYEFHRDWGAVGMPIVSMIGLFNIPESVKFSDLDTLKSRREMVNSLQHDPDITSTSDSTDSRARSHDFNTLTVGVKRGSIVSVVSKLRFVDDASTTAPLISYADAIEKLETNKYSQILTSPAGTGKVEHKVIYPENKADFRSVTVTDSRLVYLEGLPNVSQTQLAPYYLFRGYGVLTSGYRANVLAAVAATQSSVAPTRIPSSITSETVTPTQQKPLLASPVPSVAPLFSSKCIVPPTINDLSNVQSDKDGIVFGQMVGSGSGGVEAAGDNYGGWFIVPKSSIDLQQVNDILDSIYTKIRTTVQRRDILDVILAYEHAGGQLCAIGITGESPTVFLYSQTPVDVTVSPSKSTYNDPNLLDGIWSIHVENSTLSANHNDRRYLYYEHERVKFNKPSAGWYVSLNGIDALAESIGNQLKLNTQERNRLEFELNHVAKDYPSELLFVGQIPMAEVNARLPLNINPQPRNLYRYHFYIMPQAAERGVQPPPLSPIPREGLTAVEFGAVHGQ